MATLLGVSTISANAPLQSVKAFIDANVNNQCLLVDLGAKSALRPLNHSLNARLFTNSLRLPSDTELDPQVLFDFATVPASQLLEDHADEVERLREANHHLTLLALFPGDSIPNVLFPLLYASSHIDPLLLHMVFTSTKARRSQLLVDGRSWWDIKGTSYDRWGFETSMLEQFMRKRIEMKS